MGTRLEGVAVARPTWRTRQSALRLADAAAHRCLQLAEVEPCDVDLVINTGIFRDGNLGEPALASMIQEDVGINPEDPHAGGHGTFSFDLDNGTCGPLSALQVVDGFLRAGTIHRALVVTSDADPGHRLIVDFPFEAVGAAATWTWTDDDRGLGAVHWTREDDQDAPDLRAVVEPVGRGNRMRIDIDPGYALRAAQVAAEPVGKALADAGLDPADIGVVIAAPGSPVFLAQLCGHTDLRPDRVVAAAPEVHTASLLVALETATREGRMAGGGPVLLVAAAAGIVAGASVYRP